MFSLLLACPIEEQELLIARLWELGTSGIVERGETLEAFFDSRHDEWLDEFALFSPHWQAAEPTDWVELTKAAWQPKLVGDRFFLVPVWRDDQAPAGRLRLSVNPGLACGTGDHPATQLCLEAMERLIRPGVTVLDVGAGSGILSTAAHLLGAARVFACDIDEAAVAFGSRQTSGVHWFIGSAEAVRGSSTDLLVANIDAATLGAIMKELERTLRPDGIMALTGFTATDLPPVAAGEMLERDEWRCVLTPKKSF